ncbi:MAG: hypothetical protein ACLSHC_05305 [Bilophila wadsworthia]
MSFRPAIPAGRRSFLIYGRHGPGAAEFIPVSLLTPIARILPSPGMAGQTVTAVGVLAVLTSLLLAR